VRRQCQFLVNHRDAASAGVKRITGIEGLAVSSILPRQAGPPLRIFISVLLPAPFSPISVNFACGDLEETPRNARGPERFLNAREPEREVME
jgi:hypothetical protein